MKKKGTRRNQTRKERKKRHISLPTGVMDFAYRVGLKATHSSKAHQKGKNEQEKKTHTRMKKKTRWDKHITHQGVKSKPKRNTNNTGEVTHAKHPPTHTHTTTRTKTHTRRTQHKTKTRD